MATMANLFEVSLPEDAGVDSISNLPVWMNSDAKEIRSDVVHQSIDGSLSIRKGKYKLEMCPGSGGWSFPKPGEETADMPQYQLYDLDADISEQNNIINESPEIAKELRKTLVQYILQGRSTPGKPQKNNGVEIWETVKWLEEDTGGKVDLTHTLL